MTVVDCCQEDKRVVENFFSGTIAGMVVKEKLPAAKFWAEIVQACGTDDPSALAELLSPTSRSTLVFWRDSPTAKVQRKNIEKVRKLLATIPAVQEHQEAPAPPPPAQSPTTSPDILTQIRADIAAVREVAEAGREVAEAGRKVAEADHALLTALLALGREGRADETIKAYYRQAVGAESPPPRRRQARS